MLSLVQEDVVDEVDAAATATADADADAEFVTMSFDTYQRKYNKMYASVAEMEQRATIFHENVQQINDHNTNSPLGAQFQLGLNAFSDMAASELPTGLITNIHPSEKIQATHEWEAVVANTASAYGKGPSSTSALLRGGSEEETEDQQRR